MATTPAAPTSTATAPTATAPAAKVERWQRFRTNRDKALASPHGWLTLTSFQWLADSPAAVDLAPGLWSTDAKGTTAFLTAVPSDPPD